MCKIEEGERFRALLSWCSDAAGPTGSPRWSIVSFHALVARPRVYRIEDLRRFSESFVHPRTGSRGFSRALGIVAQYTAWQPGPRCRLSTPVVLFADGGARRRGDALRAFMRIHTHTRIHETHIRSFRETRAISSVFFLFLERTLEQHHPACKRSAHTAHGSPVCTDQYPRLRIRGLFSTQLELVRSVARTRQERGTQQRSPTQRVGGWRRGEGDVMIRGLRVVIS